MPASLSIIIVSYHVRYFLEQCLLSIRCATTGITTEIIVVDNASDDDTIAFLKPRFPEVQFIALAANLGFAKACNLAYRHASGNYILYLNPDTLLAEDSLQKVLDFIQTTPDAGAVGVRMIDGSGRYLPESKRGLPTVLTSVYKMCGLARLLPRSRVFGRYYMGHLSPRQTQAVEVLAGAFMLLPRAVHEKVGGFDEAFFMYGEDIDLSYRILQAGFRNYYFAETTIIHFKGESTHRGTPAFVSNFYGAMEVFAGKHYSGTKASVLRMAIRCRAVLARAARTRQINTPAHDLDTLIPVAVCANKINYSAIAAAYAATGISTTRLQQLADTRPLHPRQVLVLSTGGYGLRDYINWIQQQPSGRCFLFHQPGCTALIGSAGAAQKGLVWPLQPTANPAYGPFSIVN